MPPSKYATQINELAKGIAEITPLVKCIPTLKETISDIRVDISSMRSEITGIAKQVDTLHESCPFREDIARGANNIKRVEKLEEDVLTLNDKQHNDRLLTAKSLAKIALVVAAAGMAGANVNLSGLLGLFN